MAVVKKLKTKTVKPSKLKEKVVVSLPKEVSVPSDNLQDYTILLYGIKKIGKTSLCQYFKDCLYLMFEPGAKALAVHKRSPKNWTEFKEYVKLLEKDKKFKTVVIDPVDRLFRICEKHVCQRMAITHPSEGEWGKGWSAVREEFEEWVLGRLLHTGKGVIFISHAKDAEIKTRVGDVYHKVTSTMANQGKEVIEGVIDIWCHYRYDGEERVITIIGDDHTDAGHRLKEHFKYKDGSRIKNIPMGKSPREGFDNFITAFDNGLVRPIAPKKKFKLKKKKEK